MRAAKIDLAGTYVSYLRRIHVEELRFRMRHTMMVDRAYDLRRAGMDAAPLVLRMCRMLQQHVFRLSYLRRKRDRTSLLWHNTHAVKPVKHRPNRLCPLSDE